LKTSKAGVGAYWSAKNIFGLGCATNITLGIGKKYLIMFD